MIVGPFHGTSPGSECSLPHVFVVMAPTILEAAVQMGGNTAEPQTRVVDPRIQ